jgi:hypothetical protein
MTSFLVLVSLVLSCVGNGLLCLRLIRCPNAPSWAENIGRAFALGMGTIGWVVFWFGITGFLQPWYLIGILLPGIIYFLFFCNNFKLVSFPDFKSVSSVLLLLLMASFLMDLIEALSPPADADTLAYHFALPKQFLENGVINFVPIAVDGAIPLLTHMTYLLALELGGERSLTLWTFSTQIFMAISLYGVGRRWLSHKWALASILLFETTPAVIYGGGSGHIEIRTAIFMILGSMAIAESTKCKNPGLIIFAGMMAGFFMGSKYYGIFAATSMGIMVLLQTRKLQPILFFSCSVLICGSQWYGWNWHHSGMPIFPTLYHFFGNPISPFWNDALHQDFHLTYSSFVCVPANPLWLIWYPLATTFFPESCFDSGRIGLGPFLWMILPGIIYGLWHYRNRFHKTLIFNFTLPSFLYYVLWFLIPSNQMTRHLLPVYPIVMLGGIVVLYYITLEFKTSWCEHLLKASAVVCIFMGFGIHILFSLNYMKYYILQETRDMFYARNIGSYNVVQWINNNLTSSDRIANPTRYLNYLLEVPYIYLNNPKQLQIGAQSIFSSERIIEKLTGKIVTHVIDWSQIVDNMVKKNIYSVITFEVITYNSRTLGIPKKSKRNIFLIKNGIK